MSRTGVGSRCSLQQVTQVGRGQTKEGFVDKREPMNIMMGV